MGTSCAGGLQLTPAASSRARWRIGARLWRRMGIRHPAAGVAAGHPGIVNSSYALFKATTLVLLVAIFESLGHCARPSPVSRPGRRRWTAVRLAFAE